MNSYEAKQEARRERLEARADRLRAEGRARIKRGDDALSLIPFGQPILVGHHSEKSDRAYRGRAFNNIDKGIQALKAAGEVAARAAAVGSGGISSDDPDAVAKLTAQLEKLEAKQQQFVTINKLVRKNDRAGLAALGVRESTIEDLFTPQWGNGRGPLGIPAYELQNNSANIRRIKGRIEQLTRNATRQTKETLHNSGVRMVENAEDNRLQLFFPGKPSEAIRTALKRAGFRWSPSNGAWQRQLGNGALWSAQSVLEVFEQSK